MTLQEAIRIGLDNSEIVRVIAFGAQGIPIGGFEPTPLNTGAGAGVASSLGAGTLQSVYDPAILETQIATALSTFDTAFTTSVLWGNNTQPFNNGVQGGSLSLTGTKYPDRLGERLGHVPDRPVEADRNRCDRWASSTTSTGRTRTARSWSGPSAYTTNLQLTLTQPLLGSAPLPGQAAGPAGRPRGQPRPDRDRPAQRRRRRLAVQGRGHGPRAGRSSSNTGTWPRPTSSSGAADRAVSLAQEILNREQAELLVGRGTVADVAEAAQRLEQFNLDLVTRTSDVITTERQLRNILGLPPADNRRIIPVTPPTEARLEPDWDSSLAQMLNFQPDIVQQQILVRVAELQFLIARNQLLPQLSLNALYQFNGLGQQLDSAEAVMTGATLKALNPVIANQETGRGPQSEPGQLQQLRHLAGRLHLPDAAGHAVAAGQYPAGAIHPAASPCLSAAGRPPDDPLAGPVLPGNRRQLQAVQDGLAAAGRRRPAARRPAGLLRGRPDHDRPLPRRRQPVCHRRGDRGPVQDDLQHLDRRPGRGQGDPAGLRQHRRGRGPASAEGVHPGPRHPGCPPPAPHPARRSAWCPSSRSGRSIPTRSTPNPPPNADDPQACRPCPAPSGPLGPRPDPAAAARAGRDPAVPLADTRRAPGTGSAAVEPAPRRARPAT